MPFRISMYAQPSAAQALRFFFKLSPREKHILMYLNHGSGVPIQWFFMSIIIVAASSVERVLLIRILNVVMTAVEVVTSQE
jgi:hypothetical protein